MHRVPTHQQCCRFFRVAAAFGVWMLMLGSGCGRSVGDVVRSAITPAPPIRRHDLRVARVRANDHAYLVFRQEWPNIRFTLIRPSRERSDIVLAVPGTYTSPADMVEGFVVFEGKIIRDDERQGWDGAVVFRKGTIEIRQTNRGKLLTRDALRSVAETGASLMQAHLLVYQGKAQPFKVQPRTFRRALVMDSRGPAIMESVDAIDLTTFATDLAALGVSAAVNLDMGAWSEGWYRDPERGTAIIIGFANPTTERQSNWIVFQDTDTRARP